MGARSAYAMVVSYAVVSYRFRYLSLVALLALAACSASDGTGPDAALGADGAVGPDATISGDATAGPDAAPHPDAMPTQDANGSVDAGGGGGVASTLVASGCSAAFSASRVMVHYNTSLGITFTDAEAPYTVRGTISFDFPTGFAEAIPNPYSWVDTGIHKEVAIFDESYTTWGNHCWPAGNGPTGGSANIEVIDGPAGVVRATFSGFQLRNCINQAATCTLTGTIEATEIGIFE